MFVCQVFAVQQTSWLEGRPPAARFLEAQLLRLPGKHFSGKAYSSSANSKNSLSMPGE